MRVMLVTPITIIADNVKNAPRPEVGDIDIVTGEKKSPEGFRYYSLERFGKDLFYWADLFAILPDAETSTVTEEETQLATA